MACTLSFALLLGMIPTAEISAAKKISLSTKKLTITKGKSKTLKVKNTKKKVTWKVVSGKKYISLKKKGKTAVTVKGVKKGTAKIQAKADKKNLTCTVTVKNPEKKDNSTKATNQTVATPPSTVQPTGEPDTKNEQDDVTALKTLIAEQRGQGAIVSEDINSEEYKWENGRLTEIHWTWKYNNNQGGESIKLKGSISFSPFTELQVLECEESEITELDVTKNTKLKKLNCHGNLLKNLNVTNNINLIELDCSYNNKLTNIDVTNNIKLERLQIDRNLEMKSLDVSKNINLKYLYCLQSPLTSLDVSKNTELVELDVRGDKLSSLDVRNNLKLELLQCNVNQITDLDVTNNKNLKTLWCNANLLSSLDVSKNVALTTLYCEHNQLTSLDLTNNTKLTDLDCDDTVVVIGYNKKED